MNKYIAALTLFIASSSVIADTLSPKNPILRPLTLKEREVSLIGGVAYGEESNSDKSFAVALNAGYGVTDNLMFDLSGATYRFLERADNDYGLELAASAGIRGIYESNVNNSDDTFGLGADIFGKYVFSDDMAVHFGVGYIHWKEDVLDNRSEMHYSIGLQKRIIRNVTFSTSYTYRDLSDFVQDNAYVWQTGLTYNVDRQLDVGVFFAKTDFDTLKNGYSSDSGLETSGGVFVEYRF